MTDLEKFQKNLRGAKTDFVDHAIESAILEEDKEVIMRYLDILENFINNKYKDKYEEIFPSINKIFESYQTHESIVKIFKIILRCKNINFALIEDIIYKSLQINDEYIFAELINLMCGIHKNKTISELEQKQINKLIIKINRKFITFFIEDNRPNTYKNNYVNFLTQFHSDLCLYFLIDIIIKSKFQYNQYNHLLGKYIISNENSIPGIMKLFYYEWFFNKNGMIWFIKTIKQSYTEHNSSSTILLTLYNSIVKHRNIIMKPNIRNYILNLKYDSDVTDCQEILNVFFDVLKEPLLTKGHYGWYLDRYYDVEKKFCTLLQIIPLSTIFEKEISFGSPALVSLHIEIGSMVDSLMIDYIRILIEDGKIRELKSEKNNFFKRYQCLSSVYKLNDIKIRLRDYPNIDIKPFFFETFIINNKEKECPIWWGVYSSHKHNLIEFENKISLKLVLNGLSALYALTILHLDNWSSKEFNWDSRIFDKYSVYINELIK